MDPELLGPLIGTGILVTGALTGLRMWLHRPERGGKHLSDQQAQQLTDAVGQLQDQVHGLRGEITDLHERVDFTERLLTKGKE